MKKLILSILVCTSFTTFAQDVVKGVKETAVEAVKEKVKDVVEDKTTKVMQGKANSAVDSAKEVITTVKLDKTTFYLITNGEKKEPSEKYPDPYLSDTGKKTAENWINVLANVKFDAIYAEELISAKQTAQIIGTSKGLGIYEFETAFTKYDESFQYITNNKNVLIIANKITLVKFVNAVLGNKKLSASEKLNYKNLYIVSKTKDVKDVIVLDLN